MKDVSKCRGIGRGGGLGEFMIHEADGGFVLAPLLATDRLNKPW